MVKLGDIATFINGFAFKPDDWGTQGLPIIRIQNLTGSSSEINYFSGEYNSKYEVNTGDILISWSASLGIYKWQQEKAILNQHIFKVVFNKVTIDKDYFIYAIQHLLSDMEKETHGSTMKHITKSNFDKMAFPFPPLEEQRRIAATLDAVSEIGKLRREQLAELDKLVKSQFIEMFGDPVNILKRWTAYPLDECYEIVDGDRGKNYPKDFTDEGYCLFLSADNVTKTGFSFIKKQFITKEKDEQLRKGRLLRGDIVLTSRGTIGNLAFYDSTIPFEHMRINSGMVLLRSKKQIVPQYFLTYFTPEVFRDYMSGTAQPQMPISSMRRILIPLPPLDLQNQFAAFVQQVDKSKFEIQRSLGEIEILQKALMQQYFG